MKELNTSSALLAVFCPCPGGGAALVVLMLLCVLSVQKWGQLGVTSWIIWGMILLLWMCCLKLLTPSWKVLCCSGGWSLFYSGCTAVLLGRADILHML